MVTIVFSPTESPHPHSCITHSTDGGGELWWWWWWWAGVRCVLTVRTQLSSCHWMQTSPKQLPFHVLVFLFQWADQRTVPPTPPLLLTHPSFWLSLSVNIHPDVLSGFARPSWTNNHRQEFGECRENSVAAFGINQWPKCEAFYGAHMERKASGRGKLKSMTEAAFKCNLWTVFPKGRLPGWHEECKSATISRWPGSWPKTITTMTHTLKTMMILQNMDSLSFCPELAKTQMTHATAESVMA